MDYKYIDTENRLAGYIGRLKEKGIQALALDIECESNLHEYGEKLCLIQVFDGETAVLIDPLTIPHKALGPLIENRAILKIMFSATGDRAFLKKNCSLDIMSILDVQVAAELLPHPAKR